MRNLVEIPLDQRVVDADPGDNQRIGLKGYLPLFPSPYLLVLYLTKEVIGTRVDGFPDGMFTFGFGATGASEGVSLGAVVGSELGCLVGRVVGPSVGFLVGFPVGWRVGAIDGRSVGDNDG